MSKDMLLAAAGGSYGISPAAPGQYGQDVAPVIAEMATSTNLHPSLVLVAAILLLPFLRGAQRNVLLVLACIGALFAVLAMPMGTYLVIPFADLDFTLLRVDGLSRLFAIVFAANAIFAFLYAYTLRDVGQHVAAFTYIAAAIGAVLAGDLISFYVFWEVMAVASTFLILARRTEASHGAGLRYVLVHLFGGLLLLAGAVLHIHQTGSIAFTSISPTEPTIAAWLMLAGILVNASAFPLSSWLSESYPAATITGGVILSAYTTKTAVYALLRGFPGWEILIAVGAFMAVYGIVYAVLETDMRRIIAYAITNQVGFMVVGAGVGTGLAMNGAMGHASASIVYTALLWMGAGAVMAATGTSNLTNLGGLAKRMPVVCALTCIGAVTIAAFPFTWSFAMKSMVIAALGYEHHYLALAALEVASAAAFLHVGLLIPWFVFFAPASRHVQHLPERFSGNLATPRSALYAMGGLAAACIYFGINPTPVYELMPFDTNGFTAFKPVKIVAQFQLLFFALLTAVLLLPYLQRTNKISIEVDWFYRTGIHTLFEGIAAVLRSLATALANGLQGTIDAVYALAKALPLAVMCLVTAIGRPDGYTRDAWKTHLQRSLDAATIPASGSLLTILIGLMVVLALVIAS